MRSTQLSLDQYDTDKINNRFLEFYDPILQPWIHKEITLLEIGIHKGGSLLLWRDYFPHGTIVGIDTKMPEGFSAGERIHIFEGDQSDIRFLSKVADTLAPKGFDIIIDDASHIADFTRIAFWHLFDNHLKPGGLYVVEDWGTGYWDDWPDGRSYSRSHEKLESLSRLRWHFLSRLSIIAKKHHLRVPSFFYHFSKNPSYCHSYGMVGFIKELVDEQGAANLTRRRQSNRPRRKSKFENILITPYMVFVKKRCLHF